MVRILFTRQADRALRKMPHDAAQSIRQKLAQLADDPYARNPNATKLQGRPGYRLRVGDWRIIYEIEGEQLTILVLRIAARGGGYR